MELCGLHNPRSADCCGNVLVVCAVCVDIQDSLRESTFCFLVSLAVADFLVGVAAVPLAVWLGESDP